MQHYQVDSYRARDSIGYLVRRSTALMIECLEPALAQHGLTFTQYLILVHLRDGMAQNARGICSLLRHDSGSLTRVLDQLEERGLVQRQRSLEDRREVGLSLTAAGSKTLQSVLPVMVERMNEALHEFSALEFADLTRLLKKLITGLDNVGTGEPKRPAVL